jgi:hypothetical protein
VVDSGAVPLLVLCVQEPELTLKRISASALSDIAKHSPELGQSVCDAGAISFLAPLIQSPDGKLKRQVCSALAQIAKHSTDLAELVVEGEIFPKVLVLLKDVDVFVRKNAATLIREIVKHTPQLAQLVVNSNGVVALVDFVGETQSNTALPGIMALGYIAAFSETLALSVIVCKGVGPLVEALINEPEDHLKSAAAWSLGQIGRHSPDHAKALSDQNVLPKLLAVMMNPDSSEDLNTKCKRALKAVIQKCTHLPALEPLLHEAPESILRDVIAQFAKVLPGDVAARRAFVSSGGLQKVLSIQAEPGSKTAESIATISNLFPAEVVAYYSKDYASTLLEKIEAFQV